MAAFAFRVVSRADSRFRPADAGPGFPLARIAPPWHERVGYGTCTGARQHDDARSPMLAWAMVLRSLFHLRTSAMSSPNTRAAGAAPSAGRSATRTRTALWVVVAALLGLLVGYLVQYARVQSLQRELVSSTRSLEAAQLEAMLSGAVIEAQSGRYELARQRASDFYTGLQRRLVPAMAAEQLTEARVMLSERDSIITSLARNDPTTSGSLALVLVRFRETVRHFSADSSVVVGRP
jgi:hypothetical protein